MKSFCSHYIICELWELICFLSFFAQICTVSLSICRTKTPLQMSVSILPESFLCSRTCTENAKHLSLHKLWSLISQLSKVDNLCFGSLSLGFQCGNCQQPEIWSGCGDHLVVSNLLGMKVLFYLLTHIWKIFSPHILLGFLVIYSRNLA